MKAPRLAVTLLFLGAAAGSVTGSWLDHQAQAARNSGGTYVLPAGNPVVSGTTISSTWANNTLTDLGTAVTDSLDRNGRGAMAAPLKLSSGSSGAPGLAFSAETSSGLYRAGAGDWRAVASATECAKFKSDGTVTMNAPKVGTSGLGFTMANPAAATGFSNTLTPKNVTKAWGRVHCSGAGACTLADGFNIASISNSTSDITLTFATAMANANYAVATTVFATSYVTSVAGSVGATTGSVKFNTVASLGGAASNPNSTSFDFGFVVYAAQ